MTEPDAPESTNATERDVRPASAPSVAPSASSTDPFHFEIGKSYRETRALYDAEFERRYVAWLLGRHAGNVSAAAREAKMDRKHLYDIAKKHGLRGGT